MGRERFYSMRVHIFDYISDLKLHGFTIEEISYIIKAEYPEFIAEEKRILRENKLKRILDI